MKDAQRKSSVQKFPEPDWTKIFSEEEVLSSEIIDAGYENANDIWKVRTPLGEFVVKITRAAEKEPEDPFWRGLLVVFGLQLYDNLAYQKKLAHFINSYSPLKIPSIRRVSVKLKEIKTPYTIVECLEGKAADLKNGGQTYEIARQLGEHLGGLHRARFSYWGTFSESAKYKLRDWGSRLAEAMEILAKTEFGDKPEVRARLKEFQEKARSLPAPEAATLVFPDLRPSQFLEKDGEITALVDIESHVVGARELDLVAMEYSLETKEQTEAFKKGYEKFQPLPNISETRDVYRFVYFLVDILGETDFEKWMNHDRKF